MATYFISDLHLSPAQPKVAAGLHTFLSQEAAGADALYILGDFFDAWIGDDDDSEAALTLQQWLIDYVKSGVPVYFIRGNRDFLVGNAFAEKTGCTLMEDQTVIDLYGNRALIMHGDTLCTEDIEYLQFRAMVRDPNWQQNVLSLPLPQRRQMAKDLRAKSQSLNAIKASDIMDVTPDEVKRTMLESKVNLLIHGHTHRPAVHDLSLEGQAAKRIVLGDWHEQGWMLKATSEGKLDLIAFDL